MRAALITLSLLAACDMPASVEPQKPCNVTKVSGDSFGALTFQPLPRRRVSRTVVVYDGHILLQETGQKISYSCRVVWPQSNRYPSTYNADCSTGDNNVWMAAMPSALGEYLRSIDLSRGPMSQADGYSIGECPAV